MAAKGVLWGGLQVTCVTKSLGSMKSLVQEYQSFLCQRSHGSLDSPNCPTHTGASGSVGAIEVGIPILDSVSSAPKGYVAADHAFALWSSVSSFLPWCSLKSLAR